MNEAMIVIVTNSQITQNNANRSDQSSQWIILPVIIEVVIIADNMIVFFVTVVAVPFKSTRHNITIGKPNSQSAASPSWWSTTWKFFMTSVIIVYNDNSNIIVILDVVLMQQNNIVINTVIIMAPISSSKKKQTLWCLTISSSQYWSTFRHRWHHTCSRTSSSL